jgi:hypothetical protein
VQHQKPVGYSQRALLMGDQDDGSAALLELIEAIGQGNVPLAIEIGAGLVEDDEIRLAIDGTRQHAIVVQLLWAS